MPASCGESGELGFAFSGASEAVDACGLWTMLCACSIAFTISLGTFCWLSETKPLVERSKATGEVWILMMMTSCGIPDFTIFTTDWVSNAAFAGGCKQNASDAKIIRIQRVRTRFFITPRGSSDLSFAGMQRDGSTVEVVGQ